MPHFQTIRRSPYRPEQLYEIAADVGRYREFLPLCTESRVWNREIAAEGRVRFEASLDIAYAKLGIRETFFSHVTCDPAALSVRSTSDRAPLQHLDSRWLFTPAGGGADVSISVDYQMRGRMLQMVMNAAFDLAMRKVIAAFEERARQLFGVQTG
ncbi:MAG: type II toxin-antitoxin system RatA family toxin [Hyphomicrobiales bacterium]